MSFYTYSDAVEGLIDYLGGGLSDVAVRDCKRAIDDAYRELANAHTWTYLYRLGRVIASAPVVGVGTMTYLHSSGTHPRQVTLSGAAWPPWAGYGTIRLDTSNYRIDRRISDTVVTLDDELNPGQDLATPTPFALYRDTYLLPADYIAQDQALYERNFGGMTYTHPREWAYETRYRWNEGIPQCYTVMAGEQNPGRLVLKVFPYPSENKSIDFIYKRRPRPLSLYQYAAGTISSASGSPSLTATGTAFDQTMIGSLLRVSSTSSKPPTGSTGVNPSAFESLILEATPTTLVVSDPAPLALTGVSYLISDPVDIEVGSQLNAFKRCCEKHIGMNRTLKDKPSARLQYEEALVRAKEADSRSFAGRSAGQQTRFKQRLRDMPVGPDEP